jgi:hypothetical protein
MVTDITSVLIRNFGFSNNSTKSRIGHQKAKQWAAAFFGHKTPDEIKVSVCVGVLDGVGLKQKKGTSSRIISGQIRLAVKKPTIVKDPTKYL